MLVTQNYFLAVSRKTLVFLCLSVASVVFVPRVTEASTLVNTYSQSVTGYNTIAKATTTASGVVASSIYYGTVANFNGMGSGTNFKFQLVTGADNQQVGTPVDCYSPTTTPSSAGLTVYTGTDQTQAKPTAFTMSGTQCSVTSGTSIGVRVRRLSNNDDVTRSLYKNDSTNGVVANIAFFTTTDEASSTLALFSPTTTTTTLVNFLTNGYFPKYNTRILNTLATTSTALRVGYFIDPTEVIATEPSKNPTHIYVSALKLSNNTITTFFQPLTTTTGTATTTIDIASLPNDDYVLLIKFSNNGCFLGTSSCPFPDATAYLNITKAGSVITITRSQDVYNGTVDLNAVAMQPCSISQFDNCISNAFGYLFIPSQASLDNFKNLANTVFAKFPFAYIKDFQNTISTLYSDPSMNMPTISIPFAGGQITLLSYTMLQNTPYASTIRLIMIYVLWFVFAITMYRRSIRVINPTKL